MAQRGKAVTSVTHAVWQELSGPNGWNFSTDPNGMLSSKPAECLVGDVDHRDIHLSGVAAVMLFIQQCEKLFESRQLSQESQQIADEALVQGLNKIHRETCAQVPLFELVTVQLQPCWDPR
jgi:hypothetical protein